MIRLRFAHALMMSGMMSAALMLAAATPAHAAGSILVWPIDPVIQSDEQAAALWLENRGKQPILLQLRIFGWSQPDGESAYAEQGDIVGTPPMISVEPGKRQLVRLTRAVSAPAGTERAYRVIVDEIPTAETRGAEEKTAVGIKFQMRYSIPLFVYGEGLRWKPASTRKKDDDLSGKPLLDWRLITLDGKPQIEIRNSGPVHARLTKVSFGASAATPALAPGLLGYVLPGAKAHWPIPDGMEAGKRLRASVNDMEETEIAPMPE